MIDMRSFLDPGLQPEAEFAIEAKVMLWLNAGTGRVLAADERMLAIEGTLQVFGKERPLSVQVALGDPLLDESGSVTGSCTLRMGEEADGDAVYRVEEGALVLLGTLEGAATRIVLSTDGKHTLVEIDGPRNAQLRLTPG